MRSRRFTRPTIRHAAVRCASLMALCLTATAHAEEPLSADRPDFVESSSVVGKGRFQVETGFTSEHHKADGVKERVTSTPTLLRFGLSDSLEFRVSSDGILRLRSEDTATGITTRERGYGDLNLGIKWNTHEGDAASSTPAMAWLLHADLETGSRAFRGDGVRPSLRFVAEWALPNDWSVGVMPGIFADKNQDGDRYVGGIAAITVGKSWTDRFRTYVELAGQQLASRKNGGNIVTWDTGATYLITNDVQVDIGLAWAATKNAPDFAWGVGLAVRF